MSFYFLFAKRKKKKKKNRKAFPYCNILAWVCIYSGGEGQGISDKKVLEQKEQGLPEKGKKKKSACYVCETVVLGGWWVFHCRAKPNCSLE